MLSLTRWNPFVEVDALHRELDRLFDGSGRGVESGRERSWTPAAEVVSTEDGWTVRMALPGIDAKDVDIELDRQVLTVSGERAGTTPGQTRVSELGYGRFQRRFTVPEDVDVEKTSAAFENGMLVLTLPVSEKKKPRRIEIAIGAGDAGVAETADVAAAS